MYLTKDTSVVEPGTDKGVTAGAEFAVYKDKDNQEASPLGTLIAKEPRTSHTNMSVLEGPQK